MARYLAYAASQGGAPQLYLRPMDGLEARPVPGTEGAVDAVFLTRWPRTWVFRLKARGRKAEEGLAQRGSADHAWQYILIPLGASWGSQGTIAFVPRGFSQLFSKYQTREAPRSRLHVSRKRRCQPRSGRSSWPEARPYCFLLEPVSGEATALAVLSVATGERRNLILEGTQPRYALSGHLVYAQGGNLMAVPLNPKGLTVTGAPVSVVGGVVQSSLTGATRSRPFPRPDRWSEFRGQAFRHR